MSDCIFCKILAGEIPTSKVYEDEEVLAFLDITQVTKGHTLVIPKKHYRNLLEMDAHSSSQLFAAIPKIAQQLKTKLGAKGINLISNMEETAGQTVFHTHIHLLPRYNETDGLKIAFTANQPDFPALTTLANQVFLGETS